MNVINGILKSKGIPQLKAYFPIYFPLILVFVYKSPLLVTAEKMPFHDALKRFPFFNYYIDGFRGGVPPLWSPFMHSGEPFYFYLPICGLLTPGNSLSVLAHHLFPQIPMMSLYCWALFGDLFVFLLGCFLFFSKLAKNIYSLLFANLAIAISTITLSIYKQIFGYQAILFLPWVLFFCYKFLVKKEFINLAYLALALGLAGSVYIPIYILVYLVIFTLSLTGAVFLRKIIIEHKGKLGGFGFLMPSVLMKENRLLFHQLGKGWKVVAVSILILFFLLILPLSLLQENDSVYPLARISSGTPIGETGIEIEKESAWGNSYVTWEGSLMSILRFSFFDKIDELPVYIGTFPFVFALIGIFKVRKVFCVGVTFSTIILVWLALGPNFGLSPLFNKYFPGFNFIRHLSPFSVFICFNLTILSIYGVEYFIENWDKTKNNLKNHLNKVLLIANLVLVLLFLVLLFLSESYPNYLVWLLGFAVRDKIRMEFFILIGAILLLFWLNSNLKRSVSLAIILAILIFESIILHDPFGIYKWSSFNKSSSVRPPEIEKYIPPDFKFDFRREWILPPFLQGTRGKHFNDGNYTLFEPLLLFRDSAFIKDNNRFHLMRVYFDYLSKNILNFKPMFYVLQLPAKHTEQFSPILSQKLKRDLAITSPKIELIPGGTLSKLKIERFEPNGIALNIYTDDPAKLIYKDVYHQDWRAYINGAEVVVKKWNNLMKLIDVPSGEVRVEFKFVPKKILIGVLFLIAGNIFFLILIGVIVKKEYSSSLA